MLTFLTHYVEKGYNFLNTTITGAETGFISIVKAIIIAMMPYTFYQNQKILKINVS